MFLQTKYATKRRKVVFGNPSLETYQGCVVTFDHDQELSQLSDDHKTVAICGVSPEQVPEGILYFVRNYRSSIRHLRIVIHETEDIHDPIVNDTHKSCELETQPSPTNALSSSFAKAAKSILEDYTNDHDDEPSKPSYLVLISLQDIDTSMKFIKHFHKKAMSSFDTTTVSVFLVASLEGIGDDPINMSRYPHSNVGAPSNRARSISIQGDDNCPVCLESMTTCSDDPSLFTTVCNHTFHLECLLRCEDSPCPVCRFDHSTLCNCHTSCHVCGSTDNVFVCLICGVASCSATSSLPSTTNKEWNKANPTAVESTSTCGRSNESFFSRSHAESHYEQTLHAYALDTNTQHVWDFCGQGFVHRLIQNEQDGKLVEISEPGSVSKERSIVPGMTDLEEEEVVHRKLECLASQYHNLLKTQLDQQRQYFMQEIQNIKRMHEERKTKEKQSSQALISALKSDFNQLKQRKNNLQRKYNKVMDDIAFLRNMNESIEADREPIQNEILKLQQAHKKSQEQALKQLRFLEEKVKSLMFQLEGG
jgi:BRCA1-associated protein